MAQTSYSLTMDIAVSGMLADMAGGPKKTETYNNPDDEIPFGRAVAKISGDENGIKLPDGGGVVIVGIAVRDNQVEEGDASVENAYDNDSAVCVLRRGRIYVEVDQTVTPDSSVYVRHTANGGDDQKGIFRADADTANAVLLSGAKYVKGATAGGVAILDINLP